MAVRRETVILALDDQFTSGMARAAAATALLSGNLHDLDDTSVSASRSLGDVGDQSQRTGASARDSGDSINQLTGRLRLLTDVALTLGPALVPLGAGAVGGFAGMAAQFSALAGGVAVAVASLNGVGDALDAVNKYQLDPTEDNLAKIALEFNKLGPAGADFVVFLESITPQLREMQMLARQGFLPELADGISAFLERGPQLNNIISDLAESLGDLSSSAGEALGGERFDAFFDYLDREAGPLLTEFGRSIGYVAEGLANLFVAFAPVSSDFSSGLEAMTRSFAEWSRSLDDNQSFQEFLAYIRESGPAALDFLGSFVEALAAIAEAAAPIGQAVLPVLTGVLDVFAGIAGTGVGSTMLAAAAGFVAFNRATSVLGPALSKVGTALFLTDDAFTEAGRAAEASRASMLRAAGTAGVVMVAFQGLAAIGQAFGDFNRNLDVSNANLETFADVQASLESSALGEYANELGLDMQRLAEDFAANGREGEYVKQVMADLGAEGGSALRTLFDAGAPANEMLDSIGVSFGKNAEEANKAYTALDKLLDQYEPTGRAAQETAQSQAALTEELNYSTTSLDSLQNALKSARDMWRENRQEARGMAETFVNLGDSLDDSKVSLGDWIGELEKNAQALREFQRNAREAADKGLDKGLIKSLQAAGSEGALRMKQLSGATRAEIDRANAAWRDGEGAVRDFVKEVGGVKPKYITRLEAEVDQAMAEIARLKQQLNIPDEYVNVWVTRRVANGSPGMGPVGSADGTTVPKTGLGYADRHLYMLADGEEVISNRHGQADRHRSLLKAINANRLAEGGTAGGPRIGPNNPLFGIGRDDISAAELAGRIVNLTAAEMRQLARDMEFLSKGPLAKLGKALEKAVEMIGKELDASKQRLDALKQERDSIVSTVAARLTTSELFGQAGSVAGFDFANVTDGLTPEQIAANVAAQNSVNTSLSTAASSPVDLLRADIERAKRERELIKQLKQRGLSGAALQAAIMQDGGLEGAAALSASELADFERLYNRRDRLVGSVAAGAGDAVFGRAIDRQTAVVRELRSEARDTNRRLERLERLAEKNPKETGREVGAAVNGAAAAGQRRR